MVIYNFVLFTYTLLKKDKTKQKNNRGYLAQGEEKQYSGTTFKQRLELLKSQNPVERTAAARLLSNATDTTVIQCLIQALSIEKKLYTKIEICNSLVSLGDDAILPLIQFLGKIGSNQHYSIPEKIFEKRSYPLPRDIIARTLIRFGPTALPYLLEVLKSDEPRQLSEAIDAIGFICYYEYRRNVFEKLQELFLQNGNELIRWKIVRAMSAFPESKSFLNEIQHLYPTDELQNEINRSLELLGSTKA